jgi:Protein of unknown function (DUF3999)
MRFAAFFLLAASAFAHADAPGDYNAGLTVTVAGDAAFYRVELPPAVYEGATRADLGDLRIFNADGAAVPFALIAPAPSTVPAGHTVQLPVFPLKAQASVPDLSGLTLTLNRTTGGTSLRVSTQDGKPVAGDRLVGYVLDASEASMPFKAIELTWPPASGSMTRHLKIEASGDLSTWRTVVADAPMIDLGFEGRRLLKNRIDLPLQTARYYRVSWPADQPPLEITSAIGEFGDAPVELARRWRDVVATRVPAHVDEYEFDLGGVFPVDRVAIDLPELNSVVPAELYTRASAESPWSLRASLIAYRLRGTDQELKPAPTAIQRTTARYWMLKVDPRSGGVGSDVPHLRAGVPAQEVVFAARGAGPFTIAFGSATATPAALPVATLVPDYASASAPPIAVATAVAEAHKLGGAPRASAPIDVRRLALWAVLIFGVGLMAWMAWRLSAQLKAAADARARSAGDTSGPASDETRAL